MFDLFKQISFKYLSSYFQEHLFACKKPTVLIVSSFNLPMKKEVICQNVVYNFPKQAGFSPTLMSFHGMVQNSLGTSRVPGGEDTESKEHRSKLWSSSDMCLHEVSGSSWLAGVGEHLCTQGIFPFFLYLLGKAL